MAFDRAGFNMFDSFMHPERGYEAAGEEARRAWEEGRKYQQPYWQNGIDQTGRLTGAEDKLLNPAALQDEWSKGYETSPYAKQLLEQNRANGMDAASSMGLMGSSAAINNIQTGAGNIVSRDRQQYMNDLMQKYMLGIGLGQDIYGRGANAGQDLMRGRLETGDRLGEAEFGRHNAPGQTMGELIKAGISAYGRSGGGG